MEVRGQAKSTQAWLICFVFPSFFLSRTMWFVQCFTMTIRTDERRQTKEEWRIFFFIHLLCMSGVWSEHTADVRFFNVNYSNCLTKQQEKTSLIFSDAIALSLVIIQGSAALKITALVCWSASWLIVSRPPKTQHEGCRVIVSFIIVWVVSRSCGPCVCSDISMLLVQVIFLAPIMLCVCVHASMHTCLCVFRRSHAHINVLCMQSENNVCTCRQVSSLFCQQAPVYSLLINCLT